ncbi:MAG: hypothetical protein IPO67_04135 [Deltaproteobacteria bacterium]|nr:hypothetical protein [Deltaproteobacteria bacterium]MBK9365729.1 hypothetical protein [Deltaproteobacteria bacterium]MBK9644330.1 hypothetical protein [Deltaproteobacteria bacterium]
MRKMTLPLLALLVGCNSEDPFFNRGGSYNEVNDSFLIDSGGGDSSDDTGPACGEPGAPVITESRAAFADYPNIGDVIELGLTFCDEEADVAGGQVKLSVGVVDGTPSDLVDKFDQDGQGEACYIQDDEVICAISGVDTAESYSLTARIEDAQGNESNEISATVE